ncbi:septal ring lytic transglycosylase RlpA family protein [Bartonella sp. DGB1]|uniref:septal ring lytic transglycosylase RlpA family protein n=1 Tax=Bartonella sp. DGB1 TaxID=3239807 RepID=UPI003525C4BD
MRDKLFYITSIITLSVSLSSCGITDFNSKVSDAKEYFPESKYGVAASPRVISDKISIPRGGGREHVGKSYKIKDRWYHPQAKPAKQQVGLASWYGDAFHGRLTANGEIYDKKHLTAAHPTMPLPSYVKVTNLENGSHITVRVNDRGPYTSGRIIDLSKEAAKMLGFIDKGIAKVKIEYLGKAPLEGDDKPALVASYNSKAKLPYSHTMLASNKSVNNNQKDIVIPRQSPRSYNTESHQLAYSVPKPTISPMLAKNLTENTKISPNNIRKITFVAKLKDNKS